MDQPPDRVIRFRVGINIGDAIADGTDLHGEAVNVAARLQTECPPGAICVTRAVRDHMHGRVDTVFEALGSLNLRNISQSVEAFVLWPDAGATTRKAVERSLVLGTGETLPLPDKPSIAVLAFTNMGGDPEQEFFSDGIAEDIITELSRSRSLFVIARNSSFTYKGHPVNVRQRPGGQRASRRQSGARRSAHPIRGQLISAVLPALSDTEQLRALRFNTNSVWPHVVQGAALLFRSDRRSDAREAMLAALRLSPRDPLNVIPSMQIGISYYYPQPRSTSMYASRPPWFRPEDHEHMLEGLRKAGWDAQASA